MDTSTLNDGKSAVETTAQPEPVAQDNQGAASNDASGGDQSTQSAPAERTFTQSEVNKLVSNRLARQSTSMTNRFNQRFDELENKMNAGNQEPPKTKEDFGDDLDGWHKHNTKQIVDEALNEQAQANQRQASEVQKANEANQAWSDKIKSFAEANPDYADVVSGSGLEISNDAQADILESDFGPNIAYHLAKNPGEVEKLNKMGERARTRYFARLEARFEMTPATAANPAPATQPGENQSQPQQNAAPVVSSAPAPVQTPQGSSSTPGAMSLADWTKQRNREDRANGL